MIKGKTVYLRPLNTDDAVESLRLQTDNCDFLEKFSVPRDSDFYTMEGQIKRIKKQDEIWNLYK
jgi:ribosomal-protein-alanine N-acetyltransferase